MSNDYWSLLKESACVIAGGTSIDFQISSGAEGKAMSRCELGLQSMDDSCANIPSFDGRAYGIFLHVAFQTSLTIQSHNWLGTIIGLPRFSPLCADPVLSSTSTHRSAMM